MTKKLYRFKCLFDGNILCGEFDGVGMKRRKVLPMPCTRCKTYIRIPKIDIYGESG